jgi:thioredoxin-related protein
VDGLAEEMAVIRVDIDSEAGRALGARWRATFTPTFLLFDSQGNEIWRAAGRLDPEAVRAALRAS